jgi:hypothetical protein
MQGPDKKRLFYFECGSFVFTGIDDLLLEGFPAVFAESFVKEVL